MRELKFAETHEWYCVTCGKVGISDHAQKELGDIVFVELPEVGDAIKQGEPFANVESVKAVSEIFAPVSGTVAAVNEAVVDDPSLINSDAYSAWLIKVENAEGAEKLLSQSDYEAAL